MAAPWPTSTVLAPPAREWLRTLPPVNDSPTNAVLLDGGGTVTTDTTGATTDPLEPTAGGTASAWYTTTPTTEDAVLIDSTASSYPTEVAVFSGTVDTTVQGYGLTLVASGSGKVSYKPTAGTTYKVKVGGGSGGTQKVSRGPSVLLGRWGVPIG